MKIIGLVFLATGAAGVVIPSSTSSGFRSTSQFSAWATTHNIMAKKVSLHTFSEGMRGLIALEDIEAGECVLNVPLEMCFVKRGDDDKWPVHLALELLKEMKKGKDGKWWPYLTMLPTVEDLRSCLPIHWGADEIEEGLGENDNVFEDDLNNAIESIWTWRDSMWNNYRYSDPEDEDRGVPQSEIASRQKTPISDIIIDDDEDSSQTFSVQNRKLISTPPQMSGVGSNKPKADTVTKFSRPEFEHALDLVQTRNCCPEPSLHLIVPFFDLLNHDSSASTSITVDAASQSVRLTTQQRVPKNSQVFLNYHLETQLLSPFLTDQKSDKDDGSYPMDLSAFTLVSYGFLPTVNEVSLLLPLETIRAVLLDASTRVLVESAYEQDGGARNSRPGSALAILQRCGLQIAQPFSVYRDGVSLSFIAVLRVLSATEEERQQLWAAGEKALREEVLGSGKVEGPAKQKLLSLLAEEVERLQQVLAEQEARGPGLPQRPLKVRKQHANMALRVVQDCLEWARKL